MRENLATRDVFSLESEWGKSECEYLFHFHQ
jgi:hypothetical protein